MQQKKKKTKQDTEKTKQRKTTEHPNTEGARHAKATTQGANNAKTEKAWKKMDFFVLGGRASP